MGNECSYKLTTSPGSFTIHVCDNLKINIKTPENMSSGVFLGAYNLSLLRFRLHKVCIHSPQHYPNFR